jgi:spore maturation protein CgeB
MERAARALGHTTMLFYYRSDILGGIQSRMEHRLPAALRAVPQLAAHKVKSVRNLWMNRRLIATGRQFQPDIIIILKGEIIAKETLAALRERNRRIASWWVDDPFKYPDLAHDLEFFDTVYIFDKDCLTRLKARGLRHVVYMPCACDPTIYYPQSLDSRNFPSLNCTVGFVANYHPTRPALIGQMQGLNVGLWGAGWEGVPELTALPPGTWRGKQISPEATAKVYNLAQICPNMHHPQTRIGGLNTRTSEILAAGGFELVDNIPGLEDNFDVGREIIAYSSPAHFRELVDYYTSHPSEREAIAVRGRARVLRDHTYERRVETILGTLNSYGGRISV